jgi:hypothetical protein
MAAKAKTEAKSKSRVDNNGAEHARFSASESSRWLGCPGSVKQIEGLPAYLREKSSHYADEGTAAHKLGDRCLVKGTNPYDYLDQEIEVGKGKAVQKFKVDEDMAQAVEVYVDLCRAVVEELGPDCEWSTEYRFSLEWIRPDMFGTNDFRAFVLFDKLFIIDYKHGKGVPVEIRYPDGTINTQLIYYALGAAKDAGFQFDEVVLIICQPRCPLQSDETPGVRRATLTMQELMLWADKFGAGVDACLGPMPELCTGKHCQFCKAGGTCEERAKEAMRKAKEDWSEDDEPGPIAVPGHNGAPGALERLNQSLLWLPHVEAWCKAVAQAGFAALDAGADLKDFKLIEKIGNRAWIADMKKIEKALKKAGLTEKQMYEPPAAPKFKSPAQMEKVSKAAKAAVAEGLTDRPVTGKTVARKDDARPETKSSAKEWEDD